MSVQHNQAMKIKTSIHTRINKGLESTIHTRINKDKLLKIPNVGNDMKQLKFLCIFER